MVTPDHNHTNHTPQHLSYQRHIYSFALRHMVTPDLCQVPFRGLGIRRGTRGMWSLAHGGDTSHNHTQYSHHTKNTSATSHIMPGLASTQHHNCLHTVTHHHNHRCGPASPAYSPTSQACAIMHDCSVALLSHTTGMHSDACRSLFSASWHKGEAGHLPFPISSPYSGSHPLPQFPLSPNPYLKSLLPEVLGPQHSESSCADESRPLAQRGGLRLTVSHQSHHAAIHTDCHTVPPARGQSQWGVLLTPLLSGPQLSLYSPAVHEIDLLGEGAEGVT